MSGVLPDILARETLRSPVASLSRLTHPSPQAVRDLRCRLRQGWNVSAQRVAVASPVRARSCSPTPHDEGDAALPQPIGQPYADWMRAIVFARWITSRGVPALATHPSSIACRLLRNGGIFPLAYCVSIGYTRAMSGKDSGFRIRVERDLRERFLAACRKQDRPAAQVLREFMRSYVGDTDQPNDRREGPQ